MKKNVLTLVVSLVLVAVLSVGATLAYLSAEDVDVVNTFKFGGMTVQLSETSTDGTANANKGYDYSKLTDGMTLSKEPKVEFSTDVDAILFVKISGLGYTGTTVPGAYITCEGLTTALTAAGWASEDADSFGNGTYYRLVTAIESDPDYSGVLFSSVKTVAELDNGADVTVPDVKIQVFAIQQQGYVTEGAPVQAAKDAAATSFVA